jgi:hypothetical protein
VLQSDRVESGDRGFLVEGLAAPDYWPDPDDADEGELAIDFEVWKRRRDPSSRVVDPVAIGLECRRAGGVPVGRGWRADGRKHGELIWWGPAAAAVPVLLKVIEKVDPAVLVIDSRGKAASLLPEIRAKQLEPQVLTTGSGRRRMRRWRGTSRPTRCGCPVSRCRSWTRRRRRPPGGSRTGLRFFDRRGGGGSPAPLVSLSLARHGLLTVAAQPPKRPAQAARVVKATDVAELVGVGVGRPVERRLLEEGVTGMAEPIPLRPGAGTPPIKRRRRRRSATRARWMRASWWQIDVEETPELRWPLSVEVFDRMRRQDAQVQSVLRAVTLPVRQTDWSIDGSGCRDEVNQLVAGDLGLRIKGDTSAKPPPRTRTASPGPSTCRTRC